MAGTTFLFNGVPTGFLVLGEKKGYDILTFEKLSKDKLEKILNSAEKIVSAIRHPSTRNLVFSLIRDKSKVIEVALVDLNDIKRGDEIIVIAPKHLVRRGAELKVTWDDLAIFRVQLGGVDWRTTTYILFP